MFFLSHITSENVMVTQRLNWKGVKILLLMEITDNTDVSSGLKGTYQGLTATVLKQGSNQAIRFYVMTSLRNWYKGV